MKHWDLRYERNRRLISAIGRINVYDLPLEHLEQLKVRVFQLSATETATYVRFNLLCKRGSPDPGILAGGSHDGV